MPKAKRVTLERVVNGFIVRWKRPPAWNDSGPGPEERVYVCANLQAALQMLTDEISLTGEERDVTLAERAEQGEGE